MQQTRINLTLRKWLLMLLSLLLGSGDDYVFSLNYNLNCFKLFKYFYGCHLMSWSLKNKLNTKSIFSLCKKCNRYLALIVTGCYEVKPDHITGFTSGKNKFREDRKPMPVRPYCTFQHYAFWQLCSSELAAKHILVPHCCVLCKGHGEHLDLKDMQDYSQCILTFVLNFPDLLLLLSEIVHGLLLSQETRILGAY